MDNLRKCMVWQLCSYAVSALVCCIFFGTLVFFLALVGVTSGVLIGTVIGLKSERTVVQKAAIGAVAGGVISIEVFRVYLSFFHPVHSYGFNCFFSLFDSAKDGIARKLMPDWYDPTASAINARNRKPSLAFKKLPSMKVTKKWLLDSSGNRVYCSICLQELECGDVVKRVPCCVQPFHLGCISKWLVGHNSCPLCRRNVLKIG